jgi:hypothetical protein
MFLNKRGRFWYIVYQDNETGKRHKLSTGCEKKSEAMTRLYEFAANKNPSVPTITAHTASLISAYKTELIT